MKVLASIILIGFLAVSCTKESPVNPNTTNPTIISLTTDKTSITVGEPATITCNAEGGELNYEWDVLLGDIIPQNETGSVVKFSGAECCSGDKTISCTVSNDKGKASETIIITIVE